TLRSWLLAAIPLVVILFGCADFQPTNERTPTTVKPIDRVREGIIALSTDLKRTMVSSEALANNDPSSRPSFSRDLRSTERSVAALRRDSAELHDRASDYLLVWSGQTYTVTSQSHASGTDPRREVVKGKYDQLVSELVSAKEIVLPLMDRFTAVEKSTSALTTRSDVQQVQSEGTR